MPDPIDDSESESEEGEFYYDEDEEGGDDAEPKYQFASESTKATSSSMLTKTAPHCINLLLPENKVSVDFEQTVHDMVSTGFKSNHAFENVLLEIKGLKFAENRVHIYTS
jgi:hypothetical protein